MAGLSGLLGNVALQNILLYNTVGQLIGAGLGPYLQALQNEVNQASPLVPLSPADAALAVIRNILPADQAAAEARFAGIDADRFAQLVLLTGDAPAPEALAVGLRRKLIDAATYDRGIRQGRLRDEWADLVRELAIQQPPPGAMLDAYLEGQLPEADARARYAELGGDPDYFDILYNTQGQAPTPAQALELLNRGIIAERGQGPTATSYEQAFLEGPWRNKWLGPFLALREYIPPPRTVTAMLREGALTDAQATKYLMDSGLTADLAAAYLHAASRTKTATARQLTQSTVETLYHDRLVTRDQAKGFLEALGYAPDEAELILEAQDLALIQRALTAAQGRIHTLYVGHKTDRATAQGALVQLGIEATAADELLTVWDHERSANLRRLTPAEVASAFTKDLLDQPTAIAYLEAEGMTPYDAWLFLSIHHGSALPDQPPAGSLTAPAGP